MLVQCMLRYSFTISTPCSKGLQHRVGKPPVNRRCCNRVRMPANVSSTCAIPTAQPLNSCSNQDKSMVHGRGLRGRHSSFVLLQRDNSASIVLKFGTMLCVVF